MKDKRKAFKYRNIIVIPKSGETRWRVLTSPTSWVFMETETEARKFIDEQKDIRVRINRYFRPGGVGKTIEDSTDRGNKNVKWYLDINSSGVVHTADELSKVRSLLEKENE